MEKQIESQSFNWFDELPQAPVEHRRSSSPSMFAIQHVMPRPSNTTVVVATPQRRDRVPIWVLAFSAIAGASAFVLAAALLSLL